VAADTCPNAEFRTGPSKALPECRAYEMSSDPDKNGSGLTPFSNVQAAPGGGAVAYMSTGAFAGSQARLGRNPYVARRSATGWANRSINLPITNPGSTIIRGGADLSEDLTQNLVSSTKALTPGATEGAANLYIQNTITGQVRFAAAEVAPVFGQSSFLQETTSTQSYFFRGASKNFDHVVVMSSARLTEDAPPLGVRTPYEVTPGGVRNIAITPDGVPFSSGAEVGASLTESPTRADASSVSGDGRRIFFRTGNPPQIYMREDGVRTELISASQRSGHAGEPSSSAAYFLGASGDGSVVFFSTSSALTDDAVSDPSMDARLYRYSVETGELEELFAGTGGNTLAGLAVDDAGDNISFLHKPDAGAPFASLHHWSEAGGDRVIATFEEFGNEFDSPPSSMSPDGTKFAFTSTKQLTEEGISSPGCAQGGASTGVCQTIYLYDAEGSGGTGSLACVSCGDPGSDRPTAWAKLGGTTIGDFEFQGRDISRAIARAVDDSGRVFFDSRGRLLAGDTDSKYDTYSWRDGTLQLLTPGTVTDSTFADASADRADIYVISRDRLTGADKDDDTDVYDVRANGGLASQLGDGDGVSCEGDGCQGDPLVAPLVAPPGTTSFLGLPGVTAPSPKGDAGPITVSTVKTVRGTATKVKVKVPGKGNLRTSGSGLRRSSTTAAKAGTYSVSVRLSQRARRALRRKHQVTVRVTVRFAPAEGKAQRVRVTMTFQSKAEKHPRSSRSQRRAHALSSDVRKGR
jgi:hypothetical protein